MSRQRSLSLRAAQDCETATGPVCKCRCNGAFHGKGRVTDTRTLPLDDPHSPSSECPKCKGTGKSAWYDDEGVARMLECWKCKGAGRVLKRAVVKVELPVLEFASAPRAENGNKFGVEVTEARTDVWWCAQCKAEWTVASLPHNPACPTCGRGGWWRRFV